MRADLNGLSTPRHSSETSISRCSSSWRCARHIVASSKTHQMRSKYVGLTNASMRSHLHPESMWA